MSRRHYTSDITYRKHTVHLQTLIACRIATKYSRRLPTVAELQEEFGMQRATAYRWRAALAEARGVPNTGGIPRHKKGENHNG